MNHPEKKQSHTPFVVTVIGDRLPDMDLPAENRDEVGSGWVRRLRQMLMLRLLDREVDLIDATESGNTLHKIRERWTDDVLVRNPDVVLVHAGLSDAFGIVESNNAYAKTPADAAAVLEDLLSRTRARCPDARIVLIEPFINTIERSPMRSGPAADRLRMSGRCRRSFLVWSFAFSA